MKRVLISLGLLAGVFLAGYLPMYTKNRNLMASCQEASKGQSERLAMLESQLRTSRLASQAGMILVEAEQGNFGNARDLSSKLFDQLRMEAANAPEADRERFRRLLATRDDITSDLTALNPGVAAKLRALFVELQR